MDILHCAARVVVAPAHACIVLEELSGVSDRPMIIPMATTTRAQQRYDHRLRDLVQRTGNVSIATGLGVPRSTARGWLGKAPKVVVSVDVTNLKPPELQQEILKLRRRVKKLTALLRLALALLRSSGFTLTHERLPDERAKLRILRAVDRAREFVPLRALLRFLQLSPSRFHTWRRLQHACALNDLSVANSRFVLSAIAQKSSRGRHSGRSHVPLGFSHARGTRGRRQRVDIAFRNRTKFGPRICYAADAAHGSVTAQRYELRFAGPQPRSALDVGGCPFNPL